jgi:hypothetical protein
VFSHFDGVEWHGTGLTETSHPGVEMREGCWMHPMKRAADGGDGDTIEHKIKIGTLGSTVIPIPAHLQCFRVGLVDEPGFFKWYADGLLRMIRSIPATTVIDVHSRILGADPSAPAPACSQPEAQDRGDIFVDEHAALLARQWTDGVPSGWDQVEAIITNLGRICRLTEESVLPGEPSSQDPIRVFLEQTRCGRDYEFASAAAVMLTTLGYEVRMASGYYVHPDRFDSRSNHTPVHASDVHFWCEVRGMNDEWLIVESTPGYEVLQPKVSWRQHLASLMHTVITSAHRHAIPAMAGSLALLCVWWQWRRIWNLALTTMWYIRIRVRPDRAAIATLGLLDARSQLAEDSRPPGYTPSRWYLTTNHPTNGWVCDPLRNIIRAAEAQLFGAKPHHFGISGHDLHRSCGVVVREWTVQRLRDRSASREGKTP